MMEQQNLEVSPILRRAREREEFTFPPLVMRRFVTRLDVSREVFEEKALSLVERLQNEGRFDQRAMKEQWDFHLEIEGKTPKPKVRLTHSPLLTRNAQGGQPQTSLELFPPLVEEPAKVIIEQHRTDATPSRFEDIEIECKRWLPPIMECFEVPQIGGFLLEYRNEILRERYPMFWEDEKTLLLATLLRLFQKNDVPGNFVTPVSVEFNSAGPVELQSKIRFHMETVQKRKFEFGLSVTMSYNSLVRNEKYSIDRLFEELGKSHILLFENFVGHFTDQALEAFCQ